MTTDPDAELPEEVREALRSELTDDDNVSARRRYASTIATLLANVASWLAVDSWLGGGKAHKGDPSPEFGAAFNEFRAVATVVSMCSELASASVTANESDQVYAVAAIVRQLIECEYLLTLFLDDLDNARRWRASTPEEIRAEFTPAKMRKLGGFANEEYWRHCDNGGHPNPTGERLLQWLDPARRTWPYVREELSIDLGLHLYRIWKVVDRLLVEHHARYADVRSTARANASTAWDEWKLADPVVNALTG